MTQDNVAVFTPDPRIMPSSTIVLGFTGSLGSGVTFVSENVAKQLGYLHYELSTPIRKQAIAAGDDTYNNKQQIGNNLRKKYGFGYLAYEAIRFAETEWAKDGMKYKGLVLAGIRNLGEIRQLRQLPNFFLFSIHAEKSTRLQRLLRSGKVQNEAEFEQADRRDSEENLINGQQVKLCNYEADVVFNNETHLQTKAVQRVTNYIRNGFIDNYVYLINRYLAREPAIERPPSVDEMFMTMAYSESARSSCLKRKVGAIIAYVHDTTQDGFQRGFVVSSGHNDVPQGRPPCFFYQGQCVRDRLREDHAKLLIHCPKCGKLIKKAFECVHCRAKLAHYCLTCPKCQKDPEIHYKCPKCKTEVYETFLPGGELQKTRLLDICPSLHAEENAIIGLTGRATLSKASGKYVLYTTTFPCNFCANMIAETRIISRVVYAEPYPMEDARETLKNNEIAVDKFQGVKSSAFFRLYANY